MKRGMPLIAWLIAAVLMLDAVLVPFAHGPSCCLKRGVYGAGGGASGKAYDRKHVQHDHTNCRGHAVAVREAAVTTSRGSPSVQGIRVALGPEGHDCLACKFLAEFQVVLRGNEAVPTRVSSRAVAVSVSSHFTAVGRGLHLARAPPHFAS